MNKQQLASKIWAAANEMRSKIEASEYKDYILGFIFYKFLSEQELNYLIKEGATEEEIKEITEDSDEVQSIQNNLGYFIEYKNLFSTWLKKGSDFNIGDVRDALSAFSRLINPTHEKVFSGIFQTLDTGLSKLGNDTKSQTEAVRNLIQLISIIPMDNKQDYDVLGFIYEYLISNFAANAGKKAGEFYTPHEVSVLMSEIIAYHLRDKTDIKIYDPTSGSGSLLINIGQSVAKHMTDKNRIKYYAQELKENTYNLTRMNLIMRGILPDNIVTRCGDTLEDDWPYFDDNDKENTRDILTNLDAVVSNPPYSQKWNPTDKQYDPRFQNYGLAPKTKADYAFLLHDLFHLGSTGIMTIVLPHGVLFRGSFNKEEPQCSQDECKIRYNLIEYNNIDAIIGLPANIFFGTGIPTIIMVLKKKRENDDILIIDASKGFIKEGKNNKLRARDIKKIVDTFIGRLDIEGFSRKVSREEIRKNDYNLNIPRYVDSSEKAESWDIYASMFGGIPKSELDASCKELKSFPSLFEQLFASSVTPYVSMKTDDIKNTISENNEVIDFKKEFSDVFSDFKEYLKNMLIDNIMSVSIPKAELVIAEDIFRRIEKIKLIDKYEAYQILDDRWKIISSDLEIIQSEGEESIRYVDPKKVIKKKDGKEIEKQDGWTGHIFSFELVQKVYFNAELSQIRENERELENISTRLEELIEKVQEDDDTQCLNDDNTAFVPKEVTKRIKPYSKGNKPEIESVDEILVEVGGLFEKEKKIKSLIKEENDALQLKTKEFIENLTKEQQIRLLEEKWINPIIDELQKMPDSIVSALSSKITHLFKKYNETMLDISNSIAETEKSLCSMIDELTGDEFDLKGLSELKKLLGGGDNE